MKMSLTHLLFCTFFTVTLACGSSSKSADPQERQEESLGATGALQAEVDASNRSEWVGFDLDAARFVPAGELAKDQSWDLSFKRTSIRLGSAGVAVAILKNQDFAALQSAPSEGYLVDEIPADPAAKETVGLAFHRNEDWYAYDMSTHVLSPKNFVYVIKSSEGKVYKFKISDYYNADRLPSYIQIAWQVLP